MASQQGERRPRAVGYGRVSTKGQGLRGASLATQREHYDRWVRERGYLDVGYYEDIASGRRTDRVEYQRLLAFLREGGAEVVVVMYLDRFGRSFRESQSRCWELHDLGVRYECSAERIAGSPDDIGDVISNWKSDQESKRIGERIRTVQARLLRTDADYLPTRIPYGWRVEKYLDGGRVRRRLLVDAEEAAVVERIVHDYLEGQSCAAIAAALNAAGVRTRKGGLWAAGDMQWLISRPQNSGLVIWGRHRNEARSKEYLELPDKLPRLLPAETLARLAERRAVRASLAGPSRGPSGLLSGILYHGDCGHRMVATNGGRRKDGSRVRGYTCAEYHQRRGCSVHWVNADRLEAAVVNRLIAATDSALILVAAREHEQPAHEASRAEERAERELARCDRELLTNMRLFREGKLGEYQLGIYNAETQRVREAAEQRLQAARAERAAAAAQAARRANLLGQARSLVERWQETPLAARKAGLQQLLTRITVNGDEFELVVRL